MTNHRSHRQLIHAIGPALRTLKALDLPATIVRIGDAVDDGMGAVATDSDHVTGSGGGSSTTERLALGRADQALADLADLKRLLAMTLDNLHAITAIARRWPVAMPRREAPTASPGNDCGVCGRYTTGAASDRLRTLQAPTADGTPRPVGACDACRKCWGRILDSDHSAGMAPGAWRSFVEARTNGQKYQARDVAGVA